MSCKKYIGMISLVFAMLLCNGCSLAVEDAGETGPDRLVGAFITTEDIAEFDVEAYLNKHMGIVDGAEVMVDPKEMYEQKIYATIDGDNISFADIEGILFLNIPEMGSDGVTICRVINEGVSDVEVATDNLKGTLYLSLADINKRDIVYYRNPVYQTANGEFYMCPSMGASFESGFSGFTDTSTMTAEYSLKENDEETIHESVVEVSLAIINEPISVKILQMNADNQLIKTEEYKVDQLSEEYSIEKETVYIIVEKEVKTDVEERITREIYDCKEETCIQVYVPMDNGILSEKVVYIIRK